MITTNVADFPAPLQPARRPARRALHAGAQAGDAAHRVRGARLPRRLGLEGVPRARHRVRDRASRRVWKSRRSCPNRSSRRRPRPRTGHDENIPFSEVERMVGPELAAKAARHDPRALPGRRRVRRESGDHHRRHQVRIRSRRRSAGPGRRGADAGFVTLLAGGPVRAGTRPGRRSTSSSCATTWSRSAGTSSRRSRNFPTRSSRERASATWRSSGS